MQHYRQGDVLFVKVDSLPKGLKKQASDVIVEGETTGHAHRLVNGSIRASATAMFLVCQATAQVMHEEHATVKLPPAIYQVIRQREYSPEAIRTVAD